MKRNPYSDLVFSVLKTICSYLHNFAFSEGLKGIFLYKSNMCKSVCEKNNEKSLTFINKTVPSTYNLVTERSQRHLSIKI